MPAPLIWLSVGLAALYAGDKVTKAHREGRSKVNHYPGEDGFAVSPNDGAIVCCGIYGVFDHTGIWVDDSIIELRGNGLIRGISPERFLHNRSGEQIYVLCDDKMQPLIGERIVQRAIDSLYQYSDYDVITNNCHRFVWRCLTGESHSITSFRDLNLELSELFNTQLNWQPIKL